MQAYQVSTGGCCSLWWRVCAHALAFDCRKVKHASAHAAISKSNKSTSRNTTKWQGICDDSPKHVLACAGAGKESTTGATIACVWISSSHLFAFKFWNADCLTQNLWTGCTPGAGAGFGSCFKNKDVLQGILAAAHLCRCSRQWNIFTSNQEETDISMYSTQILQDGINLSNHCFWQSDCLMLVWFATYIRVF